LAQPARLEIIVDQANIALTAIDGDAPKKHIEKLIMLLKSRGYSELEIRFAAFEMVGDAELRQTLSYPDNHVELADFEKHVQRLRKARAMLRLPLKQGEINKLVGEFPAHLDGRHFHLAGTDPFTKVPVYRYNPDLKPAQRFAQPLEVHESQPAPDDERSGAGEFQKIGSFYTEYTKEETENE